MKLIIYTLLFLSIALFACKKEGVITSSDAILRTSVDSVHFDTVFTTVGSITKSFKIFNSNNKKLILSKVQLMGGSTSAFKLNVDGTSGTQFSNIEIASNDSIYVFVSVTINPNNNLNPFIIQDSLLINYNGNKQIVQLDAFGRNAYFLRNKRITTDTTWNNVLPFVILDGLSIDSNKTLSINKGCNIYFHANAPLIVNGTLISKGEKYDSTRITFSGDRLDNPFINYPASWPGIYFNSSSRNNVFEFCNIKNAYQSIVVLNPQPIGNKLTMNECIIDNSFDAGIIASNSSFNLRNTLITNCGSNLVILAGGNYSMNHCTVSSYNNNYFQHKNAVLSISNSIASNSNNLNIDFKNSIFYGESGLVEDEIVVEKKGTSTFSVQFFNCLYKVKNNDPNNTTFTNCLKNLNPLFDTINTFKPLYNFRLKDNSPCLNKGLPTGVSTDLDGLNRNVGLPDIGCFEKQ
jgi:hypothetical protein